MATSCPSDIVHRRNEPKGSAAGKAEEPETWLVGRRSSFEKRYLSHNLQHDVRMPCTLNRVFCGGETFGGVDDQG